MELRAPPRRFPRLQSMRFPMDRTEIMQASAIAVGNIAALTLLGLVAAYWGWQWLAPRPEPLSPAFGASEGSSADAPSLFGTIQRESPLVEMTGAAIRLLGVVAAKEGRTAYAVVMVDSKQVVAARTGDELVPGTTLTEVARDHIVLDRNGVREMLSWPEKAPVAEHPAQRANR